MKALGKKPPWVIGEWDHFRNSLLEAAEVLEKYDAVTFSELIRDLRVSAGAAVS